MIKLSILWDEKKLSNINSEDFQKEMASIYSEFEKELAATSVTNAGSIFIGFATDSDSELIKNFLNLPSDLRSGLLEYIKTYFKANNKTNIEPFKESMVTEDENILRNQKLKDLFLTFPHKDIEILIDRPRESGRDIQI